MNLFSYFLFCQWKIFIFFLLFSLISRYSSMSIFCHVTFVSLPSIIGWFKGQLKFINLYLRRNSLSNIHRVVIIIIISIIIEWGQTDFSFHWIRMYYIVDWFLNFKRIAFISFLHLVFCLTSKQSSNLLLEFFFLLWLEQIIILFSNIQWLLV